MSALEYIHNQHVVHRDAWMQNNQCGSMDQCTVHLWEDACFIILLVDLVGIEELTILKLVAGHFERSIRNARAQDIKGDNFLIDRSALTDPHCTSAM